MSVVGSQVFDAVMSRQTHRLFHHWHVDHTLYLPPQRRGFSWRPSLLSSSFFVLSFLLSSITLSLFSPAFLSVSPRLVLLLPLSSLLCCFLVLLSCSFLPVSPASFPSPRHFPISSSAFSPAISSRVMPCSFHSFCRTTFFLPSLFLSSAPIPLPARTSSEFPTKLDEAKHACDADVFAGDV